MNEERDALVHGGCDAVGYAGWGITVTVSSFRLMTTEVSNALYARCVQAAACPPPDADLHEDPAALGPWDSPARAQKPVALSHQLGAKFCAWAGGKLPTIAQWIRAAEGDTGSFAIAPFANRTIACSYGAPDAMCDELRSSTYWRGGAVGFLPLADVGGPSWDVGPYGHRGLFSAGAEWVRRRQGFGVGRCAEEGVFDDALYVADGGGAVAEEYRIAQPATSIAAATPVRLGQPDDGLPADANSSQRGSGPLEDDLAHYWNGLRCAFPP